ncbi:MAG: metallophosphoesterase family protein [Lachnospiraceae bacterium]|nr:metallophosphoesterase family protein [Lachnospiraceae bacterium]
MKVMFIADEESKAMWDYYDPRRTEGVELIISCGDLKPSYLEFLETMVNCPLLYVKGNHDRQYAQRPPLGCVCIDDRVYDYKGLRILGLGGSMRYNPDTDCQFSEEEMQARIRKVNRQIVLMNGFDLLVTHAPAKGYGDMDDLPHRGFDCFNTLMEKWKPKYMVHGHVHQTYSYKFERERQHSSGTKIINAYESYILDIGSDEHPAKGKTGSPFYDLMVAMKGRGKHNY